jgi:hypothetical protein
MFTIYAIDRDGHEHGETECATLEEAIGCLDELAAEGAMESEPDDPFFVRYGITFTDDGAAAIAQRVREFEKAGRPAYELRNLFPRSTGVSWSSYGVRDVPGRGIRRLHRRWWMGTSRRL